MLLWESLNFEIDVESSLNQYCKLNYRKVVERPSTFPVNLSYELDDHVVDDEQEEIDVIFLMFVYNRSIWNLVDHQGE